MALRYIQLLLRDVFKNIVKLQYNRNFVDRQIVHKIEIRIMQFIFVALPPYLLIVYSNDKNSRLDKQIEWENFQQMMFR